ncbi:PREDICTED: protein STAY-GREEN 2, chloroplastic-like isoform X2 [Brassica oleracea var. oleracea]|uniref:Staygreen protein domain-containing protein n=1 Tax=Brassica oleracea var. oleracea TaxID=109376 RepID=A0A0D3B874_BRAOL|nr:PREDICTED: protein STAY-GREEN 2, chloroplastic-like isoform X2 [Brassica oleracea var. oleracea]
MCSLATNLLLPSTMKPAFTEKQNTNSLFLTNKRSLMQNRSTVPVARLFGPAIFEASKLKVSFLGVDEKKHPSKLPRTYTLTHNDITAKLTLAISQSINNSQLQGWANRLFRDEVVAEWKKVKGKMSLHVHCHISGGHFLLDLIAKLRYYIFCKELPVVLKAFVHGDGNLLNSYPELQESPVWVYFHSNIPEYNKVECWGPLWEATQHNHDGNRTRKKCETLPELACPDECKCCFPSVSTIPWSRRHYQHDRGNENENENFVGGELGISVPNSERLK